MNATHHHDTKRAARLAHLLPVALAVSSCSLVLDWNPDGQPCGAEDACSEGYSCLGMFCKADGTVAKDDTCVLDRQCEDSLICSPQPHFACRTTCSTYFQYTSKCATNEYCRPVSSPDEEEGTSMVRGSCVQSECTEDDDCNQASRQGGICVTIYSGASGCWQACQIDWRTTTYDDNCDSAPNTPPKYCQPIGMEGEQRLVCLETTLSPQQENESCEPAANPCKGGLACIDGVCRKYCKPLSMGGTNTQCGSNQTCSPLQDVTPAASVCR